ncbi:hypothetical protein GF354_00640, partial [Candidatus Peregrinibacteria bacterium]|nr:hypothetical protein [Candidatus Peregrinibacteria bacterium]
MDKEKNLQSKLKEKGKDNLYSEYQELNDTLSKYEKDYARAKGLKSVLDETATGLIEGQVDENVFESKLKNVSDSTAEWLNEVNEEKEFSQIVELLKGMGIGKDELDIAKVAEKIKKYTSLPENLKIDITVLKSWFTRIDSARKSIFDQIDEEADEKLYYSVYLVFLEAVDGNVDRSYKKYLESVDYILKARTVRNIADTEKLKAKLDTDKSQQVFTKYLELKGLIDQALFDENYELGFIENSQKILDNATQDILKNDSLDDADIVKFEKLLNQILSEVLKLPSTDLNLISAFDSISSKFLRNGRAVNSDEYIGKYLSVVPKGRENSETIYSNMQNLFEVLRRSNVKDAHTTSEILNVFELYCEGKNSEALKAYKRINGILESYESQANLSNSITEALTGRDLSIYNDINQLAESLNQENTLAFYEALSSCGLSDFIPYIDIEIVAALLSEKGINLKDAASYIESVQFDAIEDINPEYLNEFIADKITDYSLDSPEFTIAEEFSNKLFDLGFQKLTRNDARTLLNFLEENAINYESAVKLAEQMSSSFNFSNLALGASEFMDVFASYAVELNAGNEEALKSVYFALEKFSARRKAILNKYNELKTELNLLAIEYKNAKSEEEKIKLRASINEKVFNVEYQRAALIRNQIQLDLANQYVFTLNSSYPSEDINQVLSEFMDLKLSGDIKFIAKKYGLEIPTLMPTLEMQEVKAYKALSDFNTLDAISNDESLRELFVSLKENPDKNLDKDQKQYFLEQSQGEMNRLEDLFQSARAKINGQSEILENPQNYSITQVEALRQLLEHYYGLANQLIGKATDVELLFQLDGSGEKVYLDKNAFEIEGAYILNIDQDGLSLAETVNADKGDAIKQAEHGLLRINELTGSGNAELYSSLDVQPTEFQLNLLFGEIKPDIEKIGSYSDRLASHKENLEGVQKKIEEASDSKIPLWHGGIADDPVQQAFDESIGFMDDYHKEIVAVRSDLISQRDKLRVMLSGSDKFFEDHPELIHLKEKRRAILQSAVDQFDYYLNDPASPFSEEARDQLSKARRELGYQKMDYLQGAAFNLASMAVIIAVTVASAGAASAATGAAATALGASATVHTGAVLVASSAAMTLGMRGGQYVSDMVDIEGQAILNYAANKQIDWSAWGLLKDFGVNMAIMGATMGGAYGASRAITYLGSKSKKIAKIAEIATKQRHLLPASSKFGAKISRVGETLMFRGGSYLSKESGEEMIQESAEAAHPLLGFMLGVAMGTRINPDVKIPGIDLTPIE